METAIACIACFVNFGFKKVLGEVAHQSEGPCPNCGSKETLKLDRSGMERAISDFFISGSYITGTFAPVYQVNESNSSPANFDATLSADAHLASALTGLVIFDYGPPTWRVGCGELSDEFEAGGALRYWAAMDLIKAAESFVVPTEALLFRVRRNPENDETISTPAAFDPPPSSIPREFGRLDEEDHPVLYVSDDIELCLHECRVSISDEIVVATLIPTRELRIIDLCTRIKWRGGTPFEDPNIYVEYLFRNRGSALEHCRALARAARDAGYDGIRYVSYYAQAKHHQKSLNLAIFGHPLSRGLLRLQSLNRVRISDMNYAFRMGPVLYQDSDSKAKIEALRKSILDGSLFRGIVQGAEKT